MARCAGTIAETHLIFVDTNVFVIALRYPDDRNGRTNRLFLDRCARRRDGVTSIVNVLEVCGILSFNLNASQLDGLYRHFERHFGIGVVPRDAESNATVAATPRAVLDRMRGGMSFGDALVADSCERYVPHARAFVSWDALHFERRLRIPTMTPADVMDRRQR